MECWSCAQSCVGLVKVVTAALSSWGQGLNHAHRTAYHNISPFSLAHSFWSTFLQCSTRLGGGGWHSCSRIQHFSVTYHFIHMWVSTSRGRKKIFWPKLTAALWDEKSGCRMQSDGHSIPIHWNSWCTFSVRAYKGPQVVTFWPGSHTEHEISLEEQASKPVKMQLVATIRVTVLFCFSISHYCFSWHILPVRLIG